MTAPSVLFIGKRDDVHCALALGFVRSHFPEHEACLGRRGDPFPCDIAMRKPDYILSYLSPWIIPADWLGRAQKAALNFHPGPPEYPGIGCTNFAIYNGERAFGVTCHHMAPQVDTGGIVAVRRFHLFEHDSVYSLTQRCYTHIFGLFYTVMWGVLAGRSLPRSDETWPRLPYRRAELDALCRVSPDMPREEMHRRIRATTFPGAPGPYLEMHGIRFCVAEARGSAA